MVVEHDLTLLDYLSDYIHICMENQARMESLRQWQALSGHKCLLMGLFRRNIRFRKIIQVRWFK